MHKNTLGFFNNIFLKKNIIKSFNVDVSSLFINNAMCREFTVLSSTENIRKMVSKSPKLTIVDKKFDNIFNSLTDDLVNDAQIKIPDVQSWFKKVIEYNVPHGKRNRGLVVVQSYLHLRGLTDFNDLSEKEGRLSMVLGWCIEFLQAFFLVADDIMDQSITRRGRPCWYTLKNVGLVAVNDAMYLEACLYRLLHKHLSAEPYYLDILHLFHDVTFKTISGQCLDTMQEGKAEEWMQQCTEEKYHQIVDFKTGFYSFYLPVACALFMAGKRDAHTHNESQDILIKMARYFQIQDDYLDCYGDPAVTGKVGTDIEDNKCSWLLIQALSRASSQQLTLLKENYGKKEQESVQAVKQVYAELQLSKVFERYEEESYDEILSLVDKISCNLPKQMFLDYADRIYKRKK